MIDGDRAIDHADATMMAVPTPAGASK